MVKNAVFIYNNANKGGAQKMILWVASTFIEKYDNIYFVSLQASNDSILIPEGINHISLNIRKSILNRMFISNIYEKKIYEVLKKINPIVVCVFSYSIAKICAKIKHRILFYLVGSERNDPHIFPFTKRLDSKRAYKKCDIMVFQTEQVRRFYKDCSRCYIIPNPYLGNINYNPLRKHERKKVIFCAAARFIKIKGFDIAIKAFQIVHRLHNDYILCLYATGSNKYVDKCKKLVRLLNIENVVRFYDSTDNIIIKMKDSMAFWLPSRAEGIPNILLEALGQGIPAIASDCPSGGPRLLTNNGQNGILVNVGDYKEIALKTIKIIEDEEYTDDLIKKEIEICNSFSSNEVREQWKNAFSGLTLKS